MELSKQVCSLDLSKRLKELGVKQESIWAWYETTDRDDTPRLNRFDEHCTVCTLPKQQWEEKYAAFTVAELGEMLPERSESFKGEESGKWYCEYDDLRQGNIKRANTEADARAKMLIYLVENGLCSVGKEDRSGIKSRLRDMRNQYPLYRSKFMDTVMVQEIRRRMRSKSIEELRQIWGENNREEYSEEAFEAIRLLIEERGEKVIPHITTTLHGSDSNRNVVVTDIHMPFWSIAYSTDVCHPVHGKVATQST